MFSNDAVWSHMWPTTRCSSDTHIYTHKYTHTHTHARTHTYTAMTPFWCTRHKGACRYTSYGRCVLQCMYVYVCVCLCVFMSVCTSMCDADTENVYFTHLLWLLYLHESLQMVEFLKSRLTIKCAIENGYRTGFWETLPLIQHMCDDSRIRATWLTHMCVANYSYVWYDSFMHGTRDSFSHFKTRHSRISHLWQN